MGILFDTSIFIGIEREQTSIDSLIEGREEETMGISVITVAELLHGIHRATSNKHRLQREAFVERIMEIFPAYPFDMQVARLYAEMWARLAKKGENIGAHDLIIAATAVSLGFEVVTLNRRDFDKINGITIHSLKE
jgi:tRNA(fMet)-specific endonuclease VapC